MLDRYSSMQSAIHGHHDHHGHGGGDHHGHSPHVIGGGRGKPVPGSKSGTTKPFPNSPLASDPQPSSKGGSSSNIPATASKRGLPKNTGMLTGDAK